jgi:hypothetical protein
MLFESPLFDDPVPDFLIEKPSWGLYLEGQSESPRREERLSRQ